MRKDFMKSVLLKSLCALFVVLPILDESAPNKKNDDMFVIPSVNVETLKNTLIEEPENYLLSYCDASLQNQNGLIHYYSEDNYSKYCFVEKLAEQEEKTKVFFDAKCIPEIGIIYFDVGLKNEIGETLEQERLYCFPFFDDNGIYDVKIDVHGFSLLASEIIELGPVEKNHHPDPHFSYMNLDGGGGGGSSTIYPIASMALSLSSYTGATAIAASCVVIPDLLEDGPIPYVFYKFKMDIALAHYNNNTNAYHNDPTSFIENQASGDYDNWLFGLFGNIAQDGCGPIAVHNMLYDSYVANGGSKIPFAAIIALFELCNADLLGGVFGANMIPNEMLEGIASTLTQNFDLYYASIVADFIHEIAVSILNNCIASSPWWLQAVLYLTYVPDLIALEASLTAVLLAVSIIGHDFIPWCASSMHSTGEIAEIFYGSAHVLYADSYSTYYSYLSARRQSIVCYWNELIDTYNYDVFGGAHYVYTTYNSGIYSSHNNPNNPNNNYAFYTYSNLYGSLGAANTLEANTKIIMAYVLVS